MALKYSIENLENVDETHQSLYKKTESGGFILDVEGAVGADRLAEVNQKAVDNALEAQRRRKTVERVTSPLGLHAASKLDAATQALKSAPQKAQKGAQSDQEAVIAQIRKDFETKLAEKDQALSQIKLNGAKARFQSELQSAGFPTKAAEMFAAANMNRVNLDEGGEIRILSEKGTPLAGSGADGFANLSDLSKELAAAMPEFLVDKGKGGGGKAPASGSGNAAPNSKFGNLAAKVTGFSDLPLE